MSLPKIISFVLLSFIGQSLFSQSKDSIISSKETVFFQNELGVDAELDKSIISIYYKRYFGKRNKFAGFVQLGGPVTVNTYQNFVVSMGGMWHLNPEGKSLTVSIKLYYQNIRQEGEFFDGIGVEYYDKEGYEFSFAPEFGYTFLIKDRLSIYPYVVPFAYSQVVGTDTRTYSYNSTVNETDLSAEQSTISQSLGLKIGLRF